MVPFNQKFHACSSGLIFSGPFYSGGLVSALLLYGAEPPSENSDKAIVIDYNVAEDYYCHMRKKKSSGLKTNNSEEAKLHNIVDMALEFSAMLRLLQAGSKQKLKNMTLSKLDEVFKAETEAEFNELHDAFCNWGVHNIVLAIKRRNGQVIKESGPVSYGQIAKIFDVIFAVVIYYSHYPNYEKSLLISEWLHAAVDTKMMKLLKNAYPGDIGSWPTTIEQVKPGEYLAIQKAVKKFIKEEHGGSITPVQFDDIYWEALNR